MNDRVKAWITDYTKEYGQDPSEMAIKMAAHLEQARESFEELGKKHASQGKHACGAAVFQRVAAKAFQLHPVKDQETVLVVADLWKSAYMEAYNSVTGAAKNEDYSSFLARF